VFLVTATCVTGLYLLNTLRASGKFASMSVDSALELPMLSEFVFRYFDKMILVVLVWIASNIFIGLKFKDKEWVYYFLISSVILMFFVEKIVWYANFAPLIELIDALS